MINKRIRLTTRLGQDEDEETLTEMYEILQSLTGQDRSRFFDNIFTDGDDQAFEIKYDPNDYDYIEFVPISEARLMEITGQPTLFKLEV